jgi:CHAT domain-containing protein
MMDFDHFLDLCGRSLFTEEYRGDLDAVWDLIQKEQPESDAEPDARAEYLRCSSIYAILIGRFGDAYRRLDELHGILDQLSPEWGLRYTNYSLLADYTRRYPPSLHFYHERGRPVNATMLSDIIGPFDIMQRMMANVNKYMAQGVIRDQGFCQILGAVSGFPLILRNAIGRIHPLSPGNGINANTKDSAVILETLSTFSASLIKYRDLAEKNGAKGIAVYLGQLILELHLACQSPASAQLMKEMHQTCDSIGDYAGLAKLKVMEGDGLLSPGFTSPLALNIIVADSFSGTADESIWDPIECDLKFSYSSEARDCYDAALDLFQTANSKRGQAAVLLRQACCLHNSVRHEPSRNAHQHLNTLVEAELKLKNSIELFGRDETNSQIVKAHQILIGITKGNPREAKETASSIGRWGAEARNEIVVHFIAVLFLRFAHQEWFKFSNMDTALLGWECVYEVAKPIGDVIPVFQSLVSRAWVHHEMFNSDACRILVEEALGMLDEVIAYLDSKIESNGDDQLGRTDRSTLLTSKSNLLWTFSHKVSSIYLRLEDLQRFHDFQTKFAFWIENDPCFHHFRKRLQEDDRTWTFDASITYPRSKIKGMWKKALADEAAKMAHGSAEISYRRLLEEGDITKGEACLSQFIEQAENKLERVWTRDLYRILACERVGNAVKAREILDSMTDNELFDGNINDFQQGYSVRGTFPTVAENALSFCVFGCDLDRARRVIDIICDISPTFFEQQNESALDFSFRLGFFGAVMREKRPLAELAFSKLLEARSIIDIRRFQTTDLDAKIGSSMAGWTTEVYLNLARICLTWNDSKTPIELASKYDHGHFGDISWTEHALLFVEMSRARAVLESLQSQAREAQKISGAPEVAPLTAAVHKRRLLRSLSSLKSQTPEQEKEISDLREEIKTFEQDGNLSSASTFIETVNSIIQPQRLYESIDENAVVVEATFGPRGVVAFAITREGIQQSIQGPTRNVDIRRPVMLTMQILREMTGYAGEEEESRKTTINELTKTISHILLLPFTETIRSKSHVIFSVSDPLTAFPFSILPFDGKPLIMHAAVSQVPSLTVLYYLSQRESESSLPSVSVLAKSPQETEELLDVARGGTDVNLHMAGIEAVNIARMFATWPIEASHLSRKDFQKYVEGGSRVMHVGTHGDINHRNPLLSSISIGHGQDFRVVDMSATRSSVNLLVFAACLSGFGKATIGSEVLGFSHVVLSTGCQAYMGSLWKVSDFGSMFLMTLFYRRLKSHPEQAVGELFRQAQLELLNMDVDRASVLLDEMVEPWETSQEQGGSEGVAENAAEFVPDAEFLVLTLRMILSQLDWTSPFYWAPFTLVGYGGFRFMGQDR